MNLRGEDGIMWGESLEYFSPYTYFKCGSLLMFYTLAGRKSILVRENIVPIPDLHYAVYSPQEKRYYFKEFRGYALEELYFYKSSPSFSGDEGMSKLRTYVTDGNVWMLYNSKQVEDMKKMLQRVARAHVKDVPTLKYKDFLKILALSLQIEDYTLYYKRCMGYMTQLHVFEQELVQLWRNVSQNK